jgi:hypothetical protein
LARLISREVTSPVEEGRARGLSGAASFFAMLRMRFMEAYRNTGSIGLRCALSRNVPAIPTGKLRKLSASIDPSPLDSMP